MKYLTTLFLLAFSLFLYSDELKVGVGVIDITPPLTTNAAGYEKRIGQAMKGVHDPLLATSLFIQNGDKSLAFCSIDNLGFTYDHVQSVMTKVKSRLDLNDFEIYIGSTHTHSGGGEFLNIPMVGELLAGPYNEEVTRLYINGIAESIFKAYENLQPGKIGFGYGNISDISQYRAKWPIGIKPLEEIALIKVEKKEGTPLALLWNFPLHPTILDKNNLYFSADFVGYTRDYLKSFIDDELTVLYFNGAQAEIIPIIKNSLRCYAACDLTGKELAESIHKIWQATPASDYISIKTIKHPYSFQPKPTPQGISLPFNKYQTEINALFFNDQYAFVTIPGELSCFYDYEFKRKASELGIAKLSVLGLVNDAHGYIITPEAWEHHTQESFLSFGGSSYGSAIAKKVEALLKEITTP